MHTTTTARPSESAPRAHGDRAGQADTITQSPGIAPPRIQACMGMCVLVVLDGQTGSVTDLFFFDYENFEKTFLNVKRQSIKE